MPTLDKKAFYQQFISELERTYLYFILSLFMCRKSVFLHLSKNFSEFKLWPCQVQVLSLWLEMTDETLEIKQSRFIFKVNWSDLLHKTLTDCQTVGVWNHSYFRLHRSSHKSHSLLKLIRYFVYYYLKSLNAKPYSYVDKGKNVDKLGEKSLSKMETFCSEGGSFIIQGAQVNSCLIPVW